MYLIHASLTMSPIRGLRSLGNNLGLAWWAKIETQNPNATYWFGPFLSRRSLNRNLSIFVGELSSEGAHSINHSLVRSRRAEPLTI